MMSKLWVCGPCFEFKMSKRSRHGARGRSGKASWRKWLHLGLGRQAGGGKIESLAVGFNSDSTAKSQGT